MNGPEVLIPLMGIIWPMSVAIIFLYLFFSSRNKIRLALIESGRDASIFKYRKSVDRVRTLKTGIICLMAGLGLFIGYLMHTLTGIPEEVAYISSTLLFVGVGLVGFYSYALKLPKETADIV